MKYIYSIRNNPGGVISIFNSMTMEEMVEAIVGVVNDIKISYEDPDDELKYRLSGDMVNENVEKFLSNYKDCLNLIKLNSHIGDKKYLIKKVVEDLKKIDKTDK